MQAIIDFLKPDKKKVLITVAIAVVLIALATVQSYTQFDYNLDVLVFGTETVVVGEGTTEFPNSVLFQGIWQTFYAIAFPTAAISGILCGIDWVSSLCAIPGFIVTILFYYVIACIIVKVKNCKGKKIKGKNP